MMLKARFTLLLVSLLPGLAIGQSKDLKPKQENKHAKIKLALSAAPPEVARAAKVVEEDKNGNQITLRGGSNGFTCFVGHPGEVGGQPFCANAPALRWESDLAQRKPTPTNAEPGVEYMLAGGTDWSGSDPTAISGAPINEPPHWMIMWPFDPATSGLPTTVKQTGTWIMWAGTPWAHLMINQRP
jgi:hypothetical protein